MLINAWSITGLQEAAANGQDIIMANRTLMIGQRDTRNRLVCAIDDVLEVLDDIPDETFATPHIVRIAFAEHVIDLETCFPDPLYDVVIIGSKVPFGPLVNGWRRLPTGMRVSRRSVELWDVSSLNTQELYRILPQ